MTGSPTKKSPTPSTTTAPDPSTEFPEWRTAYNHDRKAWSDKFAIDFTGQESMTIQSMTDDTDINILMHRFGVTGKMPQPTQLPTYGDWSDVFDYRGAIEQVKAAQEMFMAYPAQLRAKFGNDPQQFLEFCTTPGHEKEMRELGLLKPDEKPQPPSADTQALIDAIKASRAATDGSGKGPDTSGIK